MRRQQEFLKKIFWIMSAGMSAFFISVMISSLSPVVAGNAAASGRSAGIPQAPVHVTAYIDFRCGPCARGSLWLKDFMEASPGKIYLEVKYLPVSWTSDLLDFSFAECAARQGKFWDVFAELMARQAQWVRLTDPEEYFLDLATELGLNVAQLRLCWKDAGVRVKIRAMREAGKQRGVAATPTYFINDKMVVGVFYLEAEVRSLLEMESEGEGRAQ